MAQSIDLLTIYISDGFGVFLAILLLGTSSWKNSDNITEGKIIRYMLYNALISCLSDMITFTFDGTAGFGAFLAVYIGNFWLYLSNMLMGTLGVVFLITHISRKKVSKPQIILTLLLDSIGLTALIVNFFVPVVFSVSTENVYTRGRLFWLYMAIEVVFMLDGVVTYFIVRKKNPDARYFPVWEYVIPIFIGITIQSLVYGVSTICPALTIAITGIILGLNNESEAKAEILRKNNADAKVILDQSRQLEAALTQQKTRLEQIKGLAGQFSVLYFVNLLTFETENYYLNEEGTPDNAKEIDKTSENFFDAFKNSMVVYAHPDFKEAMLRFADPEFIRKLLKDKRRHDFRFLCLDVNGEYAWTDMVLMKFSDNESDEPVNIAVGYYNTDAEMREHLEVSRRQERDLEAIRGLANEYDTLHFVDLNNDSYSLYYLTDNSPDKAKEMIDESKKFSFFHKESMAAFCHPDFMDQMLRFADANYVRDLLRDQNKYTCRFLCNSNIGYQWCELALIRLDKNDIPERIAIGYTNINDKVNKELQQQQALNDALANAETANKAKTEFLFNMSHDIRTPMNAILGYTDIAINHIKEPERVQDSLKKIKTSGGHLLRLINDILEMSRIEAGKLDIVNAPVDVYAATESISNMGQSLAATKDIVFTTVIDDLKNPFVFADELHTNQVIINLISNAIKYTNPGGTVDYHIEQISEPKDTIAYYRITVHDTGIGMSDEFQHHLFESFSRENSSTVSKQEGAGLGLAIVKRILDLIGGTIHAQSKQGEGSTFIVDLPLKVMDDASIEAYKADVGTDESISDIALHSKKVLLVEDNEMNREIATEILEEAGLIVETAEDGDIAVRKVREKGIDYFDFILMDIQMPVMNGYEATAAIRRLRDGDTVPIVALSANAFKEDMDKSLAAGMNAHVAKPINVKELLTVLSNFDKSKS